MVSNSKRGDLDGDKVRRKRFFFTVRVVRQWNRVATGVVDTTQDLWVRSRSHWNRL